MKILSAISFILATSSVFSQDVNLAVEKATASYRMANFGSAKEHLAVLTEDQIVENSKALALMARIEERLGNPNRSIKLLEAGHAKGVAGSLKLLAHFKFTYDENRFLWLRNHKEPILNGVESDPEMLLFVYFISMHDQDMVYLNRGLARVKDEEIAKQPGLCEKILTFNRALLMEAIESNSNGKKRKEPK